jgi:hypothetical protein
MITDPTNPSPGAVPHPFTLNDLRPNVHSSVPEEPSATYRLTLYGLVATVVAAIGAFVWLDPLRLFARTEASPPAPALVASAAPAPPTESALPTERLDVTAPRTPVPATKSVDAPTAPVVRAPQAPAPVVRPAVRPNVASVKPESRGNPVDRTNTTVLPASPKENLLTKPEQETAAPALLTKPEERTEAPIVSKPDDDTKNAPKPAATNDQPPATE